MFAKRTRQILMASCIVIAPAAAFAQAQLQPSPPLSGQSVPGLQTGPSSTQAQQPARRSSGPMKALAAPEQNQMMASDLRGASVYTLGNEGVGDIDDLLIDTKGEVVAMIVGVGGFLGMGQKHVAIPFDAFEIIDKAGASVSGSGAERQPATAPSARTGQIGVLRPERIVLHGMTKADLMAAPDFRKDGGRADSGAGSRPTSSSSSAR